MSIDPFEERSAEHPHLSYRDILDILDDPESVWLSVWEIGFLSRLLNEPRSIPLTARQKTKLEAIYKERVLEPSR